MPTLNAQGYGVPIERAAQITGWEGRSFPTMLIAGIFGPPPPPPVDKAPLLHVAALALKQAENAGVPREHFTPVLMEFADAVYSRLAMDELRQRRWHPVTCGTELFAKLRSGEGEAELEEMLAIRSGNTKRYVVFTPEGPILTNSQPSASSPHLDADHIGKQIQIRIPSLLFY